MPPTMPVAIPEIDMQGKEHMPVPKFASGEVGVRFHACCVRGGAHALGAQLSRADLWAAGRKGWKGWQRGLGHRRALAGSEWIQPAKQKRACVGVARLGFVCSIQLCQLPRSPRVGGMHNEKFPRSVLPSLTFGDQTKASISSSHQQARKEERISHSLRGPQWLLCPDTRDSTGFAGELSKWQKGSYSTLPG